MAAVRADTVSYRPKAGEIPTSPGVYRFRDATGRVLYVGKAKSLRSRLSNYFAPLHTLHERTKRMVLTAASVEWTVVGNEFEALQLEFTWINEFDPPFNVQFRDDKSYPYLAITLQEDVPRVLVTRNRKIAGARYFGPYSRVWAIRETVDTLLKAFPMRSCSDTTYRRAEQTGRPCLLGDIGKCAAPCVGRISKADHKSIAVDFASFMSGNDTKFVVELEKKMRAASADLDYESAARFRDQLGAVQNAMSRNAVVLDEDIDTDFFGIAHDELAAAVQQFIVRGGRIRGTKSWVVDKELDVELPELIDTVLQNAYNETDLPPREVVVPLVPDDRAELEHWMSDLRVAAGQQATKVTLRMAHRGQKAALAQTVETNAKSALVLYKTRRSGDFTARSQALADIQEALDMPDAPLRMECYDVSHLSGTNIVASMVVFEDGLPRRDQYRRFSIPSSTDDTESIYQTLSRRLAHIDQDGSRYGDEPTATDTDAGLESQGATEIDTELDVETDVEINARVNAPDDDEPVIEGGKPRRRFAYRPNLLIVDGGVPQVAAAARALADAGVTDIALCGIAKRLEEIWLPESDYPVILPRNSDALFMIQRIRDEAHRFAITYQRQRRSNDVASSLSEIPGLGPARVKELLKHFGSVTRLRAADTDSIAEVKGVGPVLARQIYEQLRR